MVLVTPWEMQLKAKPRYQRCSCIDVQARPWPAIKSGEKCEPAQAEPAAALGARSAGHSVANLYLLSLKSKQELDLRLRDVFF